MFRRKPTPSAQPYRWPADLDIACDKEGFVHHGEGPIARYSLGYHGPLVHPDDLDPEDARQ